MRANIKYLYDFFDSTTIHGLSYLNNGNSKSTRSIWLIVVSTASVFAGYFLSETIAGFEMEVILS